MILALAGRRIDAPDATARFPAANVELVRERLAARLRAAGVTTIVSAAASGADLVAIEVAAAAGLRRRIVLPSDVATFRAASVADRPGPWLALYDRFIVEARIAGDLEIATIEPDDPERYERGNAAIIDEAQRLARDAGEPLEALVIWDGTSRGEGDHTAAFVDEAARRGLAVVTVSTLR